MRVQTEYYKEVLRRLSACKIVILTTFDVEDYVYDGIRVGAIGYLLKDATPDELVDAVRSAARGESIFRTAIAAKVIANAFAAAGALPAVRLDNAFSGASNDVVDSGEPDARPLCQLLYRSGTGSSAANGIWAAQ